ncbi:MAG: acetolactate synthase large subunit [Lachnospiraceae bacterium]|nr:acetolactate synthase large subunit [Lachnospiraceae bacterium]
MSTQEITVAQMLVKCLEAEGVKYIFGIPGEENLEVMEAIKDSEIQFITVRHEQGAAFMADVYGRLTRHAGICLSTLGPGATNLITGVADANSDGAPLVAITGQVGTERMHITSHQFLDLVELFKPITKRSKQIVRPDTVNEIVRIAFKYAESEKPGACHIDLPCNIAAMTIPEGPSTMPLRKGHQSHEVASLDVIEMAAGMIYQAKNPVILAGHSAVRNMASEAVTKFATNLKIPVVHTMMAKGIIPYDNPYCMWSIGIPHKDYQNKVLEDADLIIAIGYDIVEFAPGKWNRNGDHKILHIDTSAAHINKLYQPQLEVIGDIFDSLNQISLRCTRAIEPTKALEVRKQMEAQHGKYDDDMSFPVKPQRVIADIRRALGKSDILISDVGAHKMWIARQYHCYEPNTCIISNGFATMGIAVPGAIAAKLIYPKKRVLAVTGDGGFMMNSQELETAKRLGTNIVVLIFNDSSYGLIKWKQDDKYGDHCYVDFDNPDFVKYAESFGIKGYRIERTEDLLPTLNKAFEEEELAVIDCPVDYLENTKLTEELEKIYAELQNG